MNKFFQFAVQLCKKHNIQITKNTDREINTEFFNLYWNSDILSWEAKLNVRESLQPKWKYLNFDPEQFDSFKHKFEFILSKQLEIQELKNQGKISNGCLAPLFKLFKK